MTHGSCMEIPLGSGRGGIRIQDCFLQVRELRLVSALESASSEGMAGAGTTGVMIGIITAFLSTTTATYPTAEFSSIATTSIAPADFMAVDFTAAEAFTVAAVVTVAVVTGNSVALLQRQVTTRRAKSCVLQI